MAAKQHFIKGQLIGECTFLELAPSLSEKRKALFLCSCGKEFVSSISEVKVGDTKSCGCIRSKIVRDRMTKHGMKHTPEYHAWVEMRQRCNNKNNKRYGRYGGRGIVVSPEWDNSFEAFFTDMGKRPSDKHTLERSDNDGRYCKSNCKWALNKEQANNRSNNIIINYNGQDKTLSQWSDIVGINYKTLVDRIKARNWPIAKALETPINLNYGRRTN